MTYEIRKSTTKMLECLGPAGEHIWRSRLEGCWGMMPSSAPRPRLRHCGSELPPSLARRCAPLQCLAPLSLSGCTREGSPAVSWSQPAVATTGTRPTASWCLLAASAAVSLPPCPAYYFLVLPVQEMSGPVREIGP